MDSKHSKKVIELYLYGGSLGEISTKTGIPKSTVKDCIDRWKLGKIPFRDDYLPELDEIREIASYLKVNNSSVKSLSYPFLNYQVLKVMGVDLEDLLRLYKVLKDQDSSTVPMIVKTLIQFQSEGKGPLDINRAVQDLIAEKNGLTSEIQNLKDEAGSLESRKSHLLSLISTSTNDLKKVNLEKGTASRENAKLKSELENKRERIDKSDRFWKTVNKMGMNYKDIEKFFERAASLGYDADKIRYILDIEKYGLERGMSSADIGKLVLSMRQMEEEGWNRGELIRLSTIAGTLENSPSKIISALEKYSLDQGALLTENRNLEQDFHRKIAVLEQKLHAVQASVDKGEKRIRELTNEEKTMAEIISKMKQAYENDYEGIVKIKNIGKDIKKLKQNLEQNKIEEKALIQKRETLKEQIVNLSDIIKFSEGIKTLISIGFKSSDEDFLSVIKIITEHPIIKSIITDDNLKVLRNKMVQLFLKQFGNGIAAIQKDGTTAFISGEEYEKLSACIKREYDLTETIENLKEMKLEYGNDIGSLIRDAYRGTRELERGAREILSDQMHLVTQEIVGKKIDQAIQLNTMKEGALVLITTDGAGGEIAQLGRISLREIALAISEKRDKVEVATKAGKASSDLCHAIIQVLLWMLDEKHAESLRSSWREEKRPAT